MKVICTAIVLGFVSFGCGSSTSTPAERLVGNWLYTSADGSSGNGLVFRSDDTYAVLVLQETSTTSANVQEETGTYAATDTTLTTTPQQWTCSSPDPVMSYMYTFEGSTLAITGSTGAILLSPDTYPPASNAVITFGCFTTNGFVANPLAPVTN